MVILDHLRGMAVFASVVNNGSFNGAAKELGITTSAVSQQIRSLESDLGVVLLNRSTRKLSLTDAGSVFYQSAKAVVNFAKQGCTQVNELIDKVAGNLRIATTPELAVNHILPALSDWMDKHSELNVNIFAENSYIDMIEERIDISIRMSKNTKYDNFAAHPFIDVQRILVASPDYLKNSATINTPKDLTSHKLIAINLLKEFDTFTFTNVTNNQKTKVKIPTNMQTNNVMLATDMALQGHGMVCMIDIDAKKHLEQGRLVQVLPANYQLPKFVLHAVTQALEPEQQPVKITECLQLLEAYFKSLELD